eukprot:1154481-Pelagomonas_calceolata.AAC.2
MGIRRITSSSLCLRIERSLLKVAPGANKFISLLDRMSMKLQGKIDGCLTVKSKLLKGLQSVRGADDPAHT